MIDVNDLRKGVTFEIDNNLFKVLDYTHNKAGRGKASIRLKARNLRTGATIDMSFISGDRVQDVSLDHHNVQYLYNDGAFYYFMDQETFEQHAIRKDQLADTISYLKEGSEIKLTVYGNEPLDLEIPITVDLAVVEAEPAVRGDTATGLTIKVVTETGLEVQAPSFVSVGDVIRVDTRTGNYITRV